MTRRSGHASFPWELLLLIALLFGLPALAGCTRPSTNEVACAVVSGLLAFALIAVGYELLLAHREIRALRGRLARAETEAKRTLHTLHSLATQASAEPGDPALYVVHRRPTGDAVITMVRGGRA